jgi:hypothetical protein
MRDDRDDRRDGDDRRDAGDRRGAGDRRDAGTRRGDRDPEQLDERVEELESRVRDLRDELGRPPEGPLGLPRPPTPREVLSFTGEYAIPTAIAMLEANVRALKALQQVIRLLDPERSVVNEERDRLQSRAADASRLTLDRLESALEDVETTIRESDLPREDAARDLLDDARRINREIRDRVEREERTVDDARQRERDINRERWSDDADRRDEDRARGDPSSDSSDDDRSTADGDLEGGTTIELTDESATEDGEIDADADDGDRAEVDVEAELESIKDEMESRKNADEAGTADDAEATDGVGTVDGVGTADDEETAAGDDAEESATDSDEEDSTDDADDRNDVDDRDGE